MPILQLCWLQWGSENQHPGSWQCSAAAVLELSGSAWHQLGNLWLVVPGISVCPVPAWPGTAAAHHMMTISGSPWSQSTKQLLLGPINLRASWWCCGSCSIVISSCLCRKRAPSTTTRLWLGHSGHHLPPDGCRDPAQCLLGEQQVKAAGKGDLCKLLTEYGVISRAF